MGLILDTSILIASERHGLTIQNILRQARNDHGEVDVGLSTVSVVELTHGIYRAKTVAQRATRNAFRETVLQTLVVYPLTVEIALLAGQVEGEQAALGNVIAFEDLVIAVTALHLGYSVATLNLRHFERIPGLQVVSL